MRELKFRGKRKDNNEWVYGGHCEFYVEYDTDESGETVDAPSRLGHFIFMRNAIHEEVHPDSVGMFTGLKDKNGVEVYEHDGFIDEVGYGVWIEWENDNSCWALYGTNGHQEDLMCHYVEEMDFSKNIHEHPELLK